MISKDKFNSLTLDHKANLIFQKRNFVSNRKYYGFEISLYLFGGLFVEVWYFVAANEIQRIETAAYSDLALYVKHLDLEELFE